MRFMLLNIIENFQSLPEFLAVAQVAEATNMSPQFWWKQLRRRAIPHVRIGGAVRIRKSALAEWLETREVSATVGTGESRPGA
jgi:excisionase family DNA binding protein